MTTANAGLVLEAVLNGLWQGLVVTALAWCVVKLAPATSAPLRPGLFCASAGATRS